MTRLAMFLIALALPTLAPAQEGDWKPLFNGKDLAGWETWLGKPFKSVELPGVARNDRGEYAEPVGLNKDPKAVYSVVDLDGKPALRVSGEIFGAITTKDEFENYHFRVEHRWGQKKWPPREERPRDSGLLYHCVGAHGAGGTYWMKSFECQIQERDCGDFWSVAGVLVDVEAAPKDPNNPKGELVYRKGAPKIAGTTRRILRESDHEKPAGEWNMIEIYCVGQTSVHVVNGKVVMILQALRQRLDGREVPLTKGRLQLQSEGAEVFFRNMMIRPISEIPRNLLE
jgi:3-keto-disaccharide hydrolase